MAWNTVPLFFYKQREMSMNRNTEKYCGNCQQARQFSHFTPTPYMEDMDRLPYCRSCCGQKYKKYFKKLNNKAAAVWCLLAELGVPFKAEVWEVTEKVMAVEANKNKEYYLVYLQKFNDMGITASGFWDSDVMLSDILDITTYVNTENGPKDYDKLIKDWGRYEKDGKLNIAAYDFLVNTFDQYTESISDMTPNLENRYRDLVRCEWKLR